MGARSVKIEFEPDSQPIQFPKLCPCPPWSPFVIEAQFTTMPDDMPTPTAGLL